MVDHKYSHGIIWIYGEVVINVSAGDPTLGEILDVGKRDSDLVLVKFGAKKAEWVDTKDLVKYEDRSGEES